MLLLLPLLLSGVIRGRDASLFAGLLEQLGLFGLLDAVLSGGEKPAAGAKVVMVVVEAFEAFAEEEATLADIGV